MSDEDDRRTIPSFIVNRSSLRRLTRNAFALPRVVSRSSFVTRYDGHIAPPWVLRHTPTPLHSSMLGKNPPWAE